MKNYKRHVVTTWVDLMGGMFKSVNYIRQNKGATCFMDKRYEK